VQRIGAGNIGGRALAALVALTILLCVLPHGRFGLDLRVEAKATHAVLDLGPISFRIAFDSGRTCPKSNSCASAV